jgi:hypothetical protein
MDAEPSYEESIFDKHSKESFDSYTVGFQPNFYVVREERKVSRQCVPPGADINSLKGDILFSWKLLMNFMSLISIYKHHQHKYTAFIRSFHPPVLSSLCLEFLVSLHLSRLLLLSTQFI